MSEQAAVATESSFQLSGVLFGSVLTPREIVKAIAMCRLVRDLNVLLSEALPVMVAADFMHLTGPARSTVLQTVMQAARSGQAAPAAVEGIVPVTAARFAGGAATVRVAGNTIRLARDANVAISVLRWGGGILAFVLYAWDLKGAWSELHSPHANEVECDALLRRLRQRLAVYENEPQSAELTQLCEQLRAHISRAERFKVKIHGWHLVTEGTRIAVDLVGIASSVLTCAGVSIWAVPLGFLAGLGSLGITVTKSLQGFWHRIELNRLHDSSTEAMVAYSEATQQRPENLGKPGVFRFRVPGRWWCQFYMTVKWTTYDGHRITRFSCDDPAWRWKSWYSASVQVDPGATDVKVGFDVRGGNPLYKVDRLANCVWDRTEFGDKQREVFHFPKGDGVDAEFLLCGTSLHAYVYQAMVMETGPAGAPHLRYL